MKYRIVLAALAALATPAAAGDLPRLAQTIELVPPYEVLTIVRSAGLDPIGRPLRRGPIYVLRAIDDDDREVRVVVDARYGEIVSVTPVMIASRDVPLGESPPPRRGYPPPVYRSGPPIVYETDPPLERPRAGMPGDARSGRQALPPPDGIERRPLSLPRPTARPDPQANIEPDITPGPDALLPPPPERFPQRVPPPAARPTPPKRAAAAPPKQAPLPRPRPAGVAEADATPTPKSAVEPPPKAAVEPPQKAAVDEVPN